jgi:hypothetical protein
MRSVDLSIASADLPIARSPDRQIPRSSNHEIARSDREITRSPDRQMQACVLRFTSRIVASPAISRGRLFVRGDDELIAIGR